MLHWFTYRNDSGEKIPAFGIVRLTGVAVLEPGRVVLTAGRPNTFGCQWQCAINGPTPIQADRLGVCTRSPQVAALYETADGTPHFGEQWGPRDGGWKLRKQTGGFGVVGVTNSTAGLVLVEPHPLLSFVGKTDAAHNKGATGTVSIFAGPLGSETDTLANMTGVHNRFANVASGKWVRCAWNGQGSDWEIIAAEC
ncbi:MAG: hypothetical protein ACKV0T_27570 [Planctomycetales bacterium]